MIDIKIAFNIHEDGDPFHTSTFGYVLINKSNNIYLIYKMSCQCQTQCGKQCTRKRLPHCNMCWQHQHNIGLEQTYKKKSPRKTRASPRRQSSPRKLTIAEYEKQRKFCSCITQVKAKQQNVNPWKICTKSTGRITNSCKQFE